MISALATKTLSGRLDTGETGITAAGTCALIQLDRLNFDYMSLDVTLGTSNVVSNKPTVLKLQECDTTVVSSFADITGFVGGTDFTVPNSLTSAFNIYRFDVDLRNRKRYLQVVVSPATTQEMYYNARLSRAKEGPTTAAQVGVSLLVRG